VSTLRGRGPAPHGPLPAFVALSWLFVIAIIATMKHARIAELKNQLSYFLRFVRRGESVVVYDRDQPIARIDPVGASAAGAADDWTAELERSGAIRPPTAPLPRGWLRQAPTVKADVVGALLAERESGR